MQLAEWTWAVPAMCGAGNSSCPKETETLLKIFGYKGSQGKSSAFLLSLDVNFSDVSFCISSINRFTVAEFLMEIKSIQQETSCLPHSAFLYFSLHFEVKRRKARNMTLRKNKLSLCNESWEEFAALSPALWWRNSKQEKPKECKMLILCLNGLQNAVVKPWQHWHSFVRLMNENN